jgi:hypothetical protein
MKEKILCFGKYSHLIGILTYPEEAKAEYCVIYTNSGVIHKVGPNEINVRLSRALCAEGIAGFRFDSSGLGDSESLGDNSLSGDNKINEIKEAICEITKNMEVSKFIIFGLCSSSTFAIESLKKIELVKGAIIADGTFNNENEIKKLLKDALINCKLRYYKKNAFKISRWRKIISGESHFLKKKILLQVTGFLISRLKKIIISEKTKQLPEKEIVSLDFDHITGEEKRLYLLFTEGDHMYDLFNLSLKRGIFRYSKSNYIKCEILKNVDHTFTTHWSQTMLILKIKNWIKNEII